MCGLHARALWPEHLPLTLTYYSPRTTYYSHYQERMLLGHPANSTFFMQPGGKLAMHVQDGSPLTAEVHEGDGL